MNNDQLVEQIESSDSDAQVKRPMSPEGELIFGLINEINRAYVAGLSYGALKR